MDSWLRVVEVYVRVVLLERRVYIVTIVILNFREDYCFREDDEKTREDLEGSRELR